MSQALTHLMNLRTRYLGLDLANPFIIGASPLDEVPGIGPARKKALLLHFGTAKAVRGAALEDLQKARGVSATMARAIYDHFHPSG